MTLYKKWFAAAYDKTGNTIKKCWDEYIPLEKEVYSKLLKDKTTHIEGTISELGEKFNMSHEQVVGFIDGINDATDEPVDVKDLTADSSVNIIYTFEALYKKMVEFRAEHLCELTEWDAIFDETTKRKMYREQRESTTIRKQTKVGRNDPCPCGSGKKYKKCCSNQTSQVDSQVG
jgi:hypothetical protein